MLVDQIYETTRFYLHYNTTNIFTCIISINISDTYLTNCQATMFTTYFTVIDIFAFAWKFTWYLFLHVALFKPLFWFFTYTDTRRSIIFLAQSHACNFKLFIIMQIHGHPNQYSTCVHLAMLAHTSLFFFLLRFWQSPCDLWHVNPRWNT